MHAIAMGKVSLQYITKKLMVHILVLSVHWIIHVVIQQLIDRSCNARLHYDRFRFPEVASVYLWHSGRRSCLPLLPTHLTVPAVLAGVKLSEDRGGNEEE